jgi:hypothetical protein
MRWFWRLAAAQGLEFAYNLSQQVRRGSLFSGYDVELGLGAEHRER